MFFEVTHCQPPKTWPEHASVKVCGHTDLGAATLRGPHQPGGLRGSLCGAQGLSACGDQNCDQTHGRDRDGGVSPVCCRHAVPPHLSPG